MFKHPLFLHDTDNMLQPHSQTLRWGHTWGCSVRFWRRRVSRDGWRLGGLKWGLTGLTLTLKWVNIILLLQCNSDWLELSGMSDIFEQIHSLPASNGSQPMRMNMLRSDWKPCPARKTMHIKTVWTVFICIVSTDTRWREILTHFTRSCQPPNYSTFPELRMLFMNSHWQNTHPVEVKTLRSFRTWQESHYLY